MASEVKVVVPSKKGQARKKGKKNRKWGRNKLKCAAYRAAGKRELHKATRAAKRARRLARAKANKEVR